MSLKWDVEWREPPSPSETQVVTNSSTACRMVSYPSTAQNSRRMWSPNQHRGIFHVLTIEPLPLYKIPSYSLTKSKYRDGHQRFWHKKLGVVKRSPCGMGVQNVPILKLSVLTVRSNLEPI
jgi:hypothetical protein